MAAEDRGQKCLETDPVKRALAEALFAAGMSAAVKPLHIFMRSFGIRRMVVNAKPGGASVEIDMEEPCEQKQP